MHEAKRSGAVDLRRSRLHRKWHLAFAALFGTPVLGFLWFAFRLHALGNESTGYFLLIFLICGLIGYGILRKLFRRITDISATLSADPLAALPGAEGRGEGREELDAILESFHTLNSGYEKVSRRLDRRQFELTVLRDFSELCGVTTDPDEILHVTLERALALTGSDLGSVLTLSKTEPKVFVVRVSVGLGSIVAPGDRIDFDTSIAKHAVVNKTALVVEDIETDKRFGRANLAHYGSRSFVCLPIKTSRETVGVLTLSSSDPRRVYTSQDVAPLAPLLGSAALTHENLRLLGESDSGRAWLRSIGKIAAILGSSFRDGELIPAVLQELRGRLPYGSAAVFVHAENRPGIVQVKEVAGGSSGGLTRHAHHALEGTLIERSLRCESFLVVDGVDPAAPELDRLLFADRGCASCCLAPLKAEGVVFGVLAVSGPGREVLIEAEGFLAWIAGGLGLAIDRNRLLAAVQRRDQEMETIRQIGSALASSTFEIGKVLEYTMDMIREVMNVEAGSLLFLEDQQLELAVAFHSGEAAPGRARERLGQGVAGHVAARGEAVLVNDPEKSPHALPGGEGGSGFAARSILCVPMVSQGRVIGVIEVLNKVRGRFDENDRDLLQAIAASVCIALENARLYKETVAAVEHERNLRRMFQKFVPTEVIDRIIHGQEAGKAVIEELKTVTLLNIDIRNFSTHARRVGPRRTVAMLNLFFTAMGDIVFKHHGVVDKYLGDGFLAVFGAPASGAEDADHAVAAALEMRGALAPVNRRLREEMGLVVETGISLHTGEVLAGNIGFDKKMDYTVIGEAVNTVFRLQVLSRGYPNGVLVSKNTLDAVSPGLRVQAVPVPEAPSGDLAGVMVFELLGAAVPPAADHVGADTQRPSDQSRPPRPERPLPVPAR